MLVSNRDEQFEMIKFFQSDSLEKLGFGYVAWNETYLSADGLAVLAGYPMPSVPKESCFRIVFFIHYWKNGHPLHSPYGDLQLPEITP